MTENFSWGRNGSFACPAEGKAFGVGATLTGRAIAITSTKDSASPFRQSGWSLPVANRTWRTPILTVYCHPCPHLESQHLGGCGRRIVASLRPAWTTGQDLVLKAQTRQQETSYEETRWAFPLKTCSTCFPYIIVLFTIISIKNNIHWFERKKTNTYSVSCSKCFQSSITFHLHKNSSVTYTPVAIFQIRQK